MRAVVQRVREASVKVDGRVISAIKKGVVLLLGIAKGDTIDDARYLAGRISRLRIFDDANGKMNLDLKQIGGEVLSVSQFTLMADTAKGNRPGFEPAEEPGRAEKIWRGFNTEMALCGVSVQEGEFAADMQVELVNDGPVTLILESKVTKKD
jgi:D-tyrosyl-tRNA(Tyr) deacylase